MCALELAGKRVAIWAGRAALDVTIVLLPGAADREMPRGVIGHRTLDAEQAGVEIGDDQEEGVAGVVRVGHGPCSIAQILRMIKDVIIRKIRTQKAGELSPYRGRVTAVCCFRLTL